MASHRVRLGRAALAPLLAPFFAFAALSAQDRPAAAPGEPAAEPALTVPAGRLAVGDLIGLVERHAGCNILVDPAVIEPVRPFDLEHPIEIGVAEALDTLSSLLYARDLALLPVVTDKGVHEVISILGPRRGDLMANAAERSVEQVLAAPESKRVVTVFVQLEHVRAAVVVNSLRPLIASARTGVTIASLADPSRLVMTGFQHRIANAIKIVQAVDRPRAGAAAATDGAPGQAAAGGDLAFKLLTDRLERLEHRLARLEKLVEPLVGDAAARPGKAGKARGK